ncbi:MAG: thioredoxin domain-containing protein [Lewinellaceae bacterium]|nr:thioredoxin domain-containing protein [Lewinellaceae bacterium]
MNHLQYETSPYLLQHAHNPVDWHAWKPEAFERAKAEDKPILVSIGYSTCHWCHVMERESFENEQVAAFMNEHFINIKVDREERPDVDQIYMEACQAISGSGGWPLNCFLTPDGRPFFAGTYYPPRPAHNRPSWMQLLDNISGAFRTRRQEVEQQAQQLTETIRNADNLFVKPDWANVPAEEAFSKVLITNIFSALQQQFDTRYGGFGGAPKFPGTMGLRFLLEYHHLTHNSVALNHVEFSLQKMIMGGIYDQIGGGFARYATDREWLVPHFEKMLYDNALLVSLLADTYRLTRNPLYKETIEQTLDFVSREMSSPEGGFYAALDADSEGVEGKFYVWNKKEIEAELKEEAPFFNAYYGVTDEGNWEGVNILHRRQNLEDFAREQGVGEEQARQRLAVAGERLMSLRARRIRPGLDDKSLLGWNALMATAYAKAYAALGKPAYREAAERNLAFLLEKMKQGSGQALFHTYKEGKAQYDAFLDDYALLIEALIETYQVNFDRYFLEQAGDYTDHVIEHYLDPETKLFYFTTAGQQDLPLRRKDLYDSALPSGNSTMVHNLHRLGILLGRRDFSELAIEMLRGVRSAVERYPSSFARWARAMLYQAYPYYEVAVVGQNAGAKAKGITAAFVPNMVIMSGEESNEGFPLLAGKGGVGDTNIYICKEYACQAPVKTVEEALAMMNISSSTL